jgi:23S rRNA (guanosine2251-2'-O)-methyltransferase
VRSLEGVDPEELFAHVRDPGRPPGLWLALDCVQDPHNLGAVFRSAAFFGVRGILLTRDRSAPLSAVVYDVASGGMESVPFASPPNLDRALKTARDAGLWILGAAEEAKHDVSRVPRDRPWLLVLGNEESGLRRLTRENCDDLCRITSHGEVGSLNISAAGAVLMANLTSVGRAATSGEAAG